MRSVIVTVPPEPVVSVTDMKAHLRVSHDHEDDLIGMMVAAAQGHIDGPDGWLGRAIGEQTLMLTRPAFCQSPGGAVITLPMPPIVSVEAVEYDDRDGARQTVDPASYSLVGDMLAPCPGFCWPAAQTVRITYKAGYPKTVDAEPKSTVPAPIVAAIRLMAGDLFENRSSVSNATRAPIDMSVTVERLLMPFKVWRV